MKVILEDEKREQQIQVSPPIIRGFSFGALLFVGLISMIAGGTGMGVAVTHVDGLFRTGDKALVWQDLRQKKETFAPGGSPPPGPREKEGIPAGEAKGPTGSPPKAQLKIYEEELTKGKSRPAERHEEKEIIERVEKTPRAIPRAPGFVPPIPDPPGIPPIPPLK